MKVLDTRPSQLTDLQIRILHERNQVGRLVTCYYESDEHEHVYDKIMAYVDKLRDLNKFIRSYESRATRYFIELLEIYHEANEVIDKLPRVLVDVYDLVLKAHDLTDTFKTKEKRETYKQHIEQFIKTKGN